MKTTFRILTRFLLMLALVLPSGMVLAQGATPTPAPTAAAGEPPPGFVAYTVKRGDNLYRLALRTGTTIEKLREVNNLKTDVLQIGQVLFIPGFVASTAPVLPARPANLPPGSITIVGSGATFPVPVYQAWIFAYQGVDPVAAINYQGTGSGAGKRAIIDRTVDFAGSDSLLTDAEYAAGGDLQMIPMVAGAVVPIFNLRVDSQPITDLTLSRTVLADIYLGKITRWNDPAIARLNRNIKLPNTAIITVNRSDSSGTTEIFTKALSQFSSEWASKVGAGPAVQWPAPGALGGRGNPGVAATVANTPNSIGYVELSYAVSNKLAYAKMVNKAGAVVIANGDSLRSAMSDFSGKFSPRLTADIVDAPGRLSWPIAGYTYVIVRMSGYTDCAKTQTMLAFFQWALTSNTAAGIANGLGYATLPGEVRSQALARLAQITCDGKRALP